MLSVRRTLNLLCRCRVSHVMRASLAVVAAAAAARLAGVSSVRDVISDSVVGGWLRLMLYDVIIRSSSAGSRVDSCKMKPYQRARRRIDIIACYELSFAVVTPLQTAFPFLKHC